MARVWTPLKWGKHRGKTLPQLVLADPDYFFWAIEKKRFRNELVAEAQEVNRKAQAIRIPQSGEGKIVAEFAIHPSVGKFAGVYFVSFDPEVHQDSPDAIYRDVIDLSIPRSIAPYDKWGSKTLASVVKHRYIGRRATDGPTPTRA